VLIVAPMPIGEIIGLLAQNNTEAVVGAITRKGDGWIVVRQEACRHALCAVG
jgi:hypothetical protein